MARALVVAVLLTACGAERPVHDETMRQALSQIRTAIRHFHDDNGRHPHSLEELIPRYLTRVPVDPVTGSATTWRFTTEEAVRPSADFSTNAPPPSKPEIVDVHSGAAGGDSRGKAWSEY